MYHTLSKAVLDDAQLRCIQKRSRKMYYFVQEGNWSNYCSCWTGEVETTVQALQE